MFNQKMENYLQCHNPRVIISKGVPFPSDEDVQKLLKEISAEHCVTQKLTPENFEIKVPAEFRSSIFAKSFITRFPPNKDTNTKYDNDDGQFDCRSFSLKEHGYYIHYDIGIPTQDQIELRRMGDNELCDNIHLDSTNVATHTLMETIGGFSAFSKQWFCDSCANKLKRLKNENKLRCKICRFTKIIPPIINIILDYCRIPFTLGKNNMAPYQISSLSDWVRFLRLWQYEYSIVWYINCNVKNPLYGWISAHGPESDTSLTENIQILEKKFLALFQKIDC